MSSFEVLDLFTLGDLENLIDSKWSDFKDLFAQPKSIKIKDYRNTAQKSIF